MGVHFQKPLAGGSLGFDVPAAVEKLKFTQHDPGRKGGGGCCGVVWCGVVVVVELGRGLRGSAAESFI